MRFTVHMAHWPSTCGQSLVIASQLLIFYQSAVKEAHGSDFEKVRTVAVARREALLCGVISP